jgi:hypothetical protein
MDLEYGPWKAGYSSRITSNAFTEGVAQLEKRFAMHSIFWWLSLLYAHVLHVYVVVSKDPALFEFDFHVCQKHKQNQCRKFRLLNS